LGHGAFGEVSAVADLPFVVHVGEDGADEVGDSGFVREDPHDPGPSLDLFVDPFQRVG
jgi:hypothetical protein